MGENLNRTIEVESEMKPKYTSKYNNIDSDMSSCKINVSNPIVKKYADDIISIINKGNTNITGDINTATTLLQSINNIEETDLTIEDDTLNLTKGIPTSKLKDADESFFQPPENIVKGKDGKNYYVFQDGDNTYRYNIKDKKFYVNDSGDSYAGNVYICIPEGVSDYSKLNTITMLNGPEKNGQSEHSKTAKGAEGNSIVISLGNADKDVSPETDNAEIIAAITKMVNHAANTDLSKCQNIITGGSRLGANSLRIAAQTGDLYQTVICVNNAVIVNGENYDSRKYQDKVCFANLEELQGLNGKNIYFISTRGDGNINHKMGNTLTNIPNAYLYTGIELAIKNCPDSQIYLVENTGKEEFKELTGPNFHYRPDLWKVFTNDYENKYDHHSYYKNILRDICSTFGGLK